MFSGLPIGSSQLWTPKSPGNLLAWYDANVGVTRSSNDVSNWADQSGNGYDFSQSSGSNKPQFDNFGPPANGRPAISFNQDGISGRFLINTGGLASYLSTGGITQKNPVTIFVTMNPDSTAINTQVSTLISWDDSPTLSSIATFGIDPSQHFVIAYNGISLAVTGSSSVGPANELFYGVSVGSDGYYNSYLNTSTDIVNNNGTSTRETGLATTTRVLLGIGWVGPTFAGKIAEMAIYSSKLNSKEFLNYYNYSKTKWGL